MAALVQPAEAAPFFKQPDTADCINRIFHHATRQSANALDKLTYAVERIQKFSPLGAHLINFARARGIKICVWRHLDAEGEFDEDLNTVKIRMNLPVTHTDNVVVHELGHAVIAANGFNMKRFSKNHDVESRVVFSITGEILARVLSVTVLHEMQQNGEPRPWYYMMGDTDNIERHMSFAFKNAYDAARANGKSSQEALAVAVPVAIENAFSHQKFLDDYNEKRLAHEVSMATGWQTQTPGQVITPTVFSRIGQITPELNLTAGVNIPDLTKATGRNRKMFHAFAELQRRNCRCDGDFSDPRNPFRSVNFMYAYHIKAQCGGTSLNALNQAQNPLQSAVQICKMTG